MTLTGKSDQSVGSLMERALEGNIAEVHSVSLLVTYLLSRLGIFSTQVSRSTSLISTGIRFS